MCHRPSRALAPPHTHVQLSVPVFEVKASPPPQTHWIKVDENVIFVIPTFLFVLREKQQGTLGSVTVLQESIYYGGGHPHCANTK